MECTWFEREERNCFSLYPFRKSLPPEQRRGKRRPYPYSYVFMFKYDNGSIISRCRCSRKRAERIAVKFAEKEGESILIGRQVGLNDEYFPIYESIGQVLTGKADPLGNEQLEDWILGLTRELRGLATPEAERLAIRAVGILDFEFGLVDPKTLTRALDQVQSVVANPSTRFMTAQTRSIAGSLQRVVNRTWRGTARMPRVRQGLRTGFSMPDREVSRLLSRHHSFWVRDQYGRVSSSISNDARKIIARGVSEGSDRDVIARRLEKRFGERLKQPNYWKTVASNHITRARSYSMGATMQAAGITHYKIEAILDDRTTHQCVFLHQKILPVSAAIQRASQVMQSNDPLEVLKQQPFIQDRGDSLVIEYPGGRERHVADITERSTGLSPYGPTAAFANGISPGQMVDAAIGFPPYHHGCRTTIIAM